MTGYVELQVTSNFSFLRGASHADELVTTARALGHEAIAITDYNTLAGIVRGHVAARDAGLQFIVGCRLDLQDAPGLLCYPTDRAAYARLCRLLTLGQRRAEKGRCILTLQDVAEEAEGQIFIIVPPASMPGVEFGAQVLQVRDGLAALCYLAAQMLYQGGDQARLDALSRLAEQAGTPLIATNDVQYHAPERQSLQDVMTCIREGCTITQAGYRLHANAERHLKSAAEMGSLFAGYEDAVARTLEVARLCSFSLDELRYEYPDEPVPAGVTPQDHLARISWAGAGARYPGGIPDKVRKLIERELTLIDELDYAPYFLTVHDIVQWARSQGILCQGRGSAANSAVCYALGVTSVDPHEVDLLFERFINAARREPPDIDVDFEHVRREEVIQYIYARYGRMKAGLTATVIHYRWRRAIREVGKVMGLSPDITGLLAGIAWGSHDSDTRPSRLREAGLDQKDPHLMRIIDLARELVGFPRHLSQHVGGFVLTRGPLCELVPIGNAAMEDRTVIEWDKNDIEALGILKVDVLGLGMLNCLAKGFALIRQHYNRDFDLVTVPKELPDVYDMLCRADAIGVFQVESRAQMSMLPRLKPRCYYDLVIEVAIVRPGPIQGDMVHPYLRRRNGEEPVTFPQPDSEHGPPDELRQVLGRTCGVPLFQEQAMRLAIVAAGFSGADANRLRKAMATFRHTGTIGNFRQKFIEGMVRRGYEQDFAERCFRMIEGFGDYGFPESHAASFALLVYVSAWLKWAYPDVFACALLNAQPMGFYAPAQIVRDAREHGVEVRPVDVNESHWDNGLEPTGGGGHALRLGFRQVTGIKEDDAHQIAIARGNGYPTIEELRRRTRLSVVILETLAAADAFRSMGLDRRQALWDVRALSKDSALPLFAYAETSDQGREKPVALPPMPLSEQVINDYQTMRLSLKAHPMTFLREEMAHQGIIPAIDLLSVKNGENVSLAGLVLVRQRPGTASGVIFMTVEDETGVANIIIWPKIMEAHRAIVMGSRLVQVEGEAQKAHGVIHIIARRLTDRSEDLVRLMPLQNHHAEAAPASMQRHPRNIRIVPNSRDFH